MSSPSSSGNARRRATSPDGKLPMPGADGLASPAAWPLALTALAFLAHAPTLPLPAWLPLGLALVSRRLPRRPWAGSLRLAGLLVCCAVAGQVFGWLSSDTWRLCLLATLALKWAESDSQREYALVAAAACVAVAIGLLHWGDGVGLLFAVVSACLLIAVYSGFSPTDCGTAPVRQGLGILGEAARRLLVSLPLAAVLFLFFPRIPGPLWDIGMTFGLPLPASIEKSNQGLGISGRLKPGQTQTGASDGQAVLIAEFRNWVPPTSLLYWRGPVFYDFDGQEWQLDTDYTVGNGRRIMQKGWRRSADFRAVLRSTAQEVHYRIRLTPHGGLWLYGLDLPSRLTSESFIAPDWQVLAHMPVREEISYDLSSWLEWTDGGELAPAVRQRALALPPNSNPRLRAFGAALTGTDDTDSVLQQALAALARGGYGVRDRFTPPTGEHALDTFWFETREGNAEFFAASFVVLMRAAGIPARLVTGYRGGKLMALTDYVLVKRSHAHAWVEIWDQRKGWRRVDPVDVVAPERFTGRSAPPKPVPPTAPRTTPAAAPRSSADSLAPPSPSGGFSTTTVPHSPAGAGWTPPDIAGWLGRWAFRLDGEHQQTLLAGKGGGLAWIWLLVIAASGSAGVFAIGLLWRRWREHRRRPLPERAWQQACRRLAGKGLCRRPAECPSDFARRVVGERPAWAGAMTRLADAYASWRYGSTPDTVAAEVPVAARHLINRILAE
jgi:transglutaminase-like putative cysteine protease